MRLEKVWNPKEYWSVKIRFHHLQILRSPKGYSLSKASNESVTVSPASLRRFVLALLFRLELMVKEAAMELSSLEFTRMKDLRSARSQVAAPNHQREVAPITIMNKVNICHSFPRAVLPVILA